MRGGKELGLFISNEVMNDIIKIINSLENSNAFTSTVKSKKKKKKKCRFLSVLSAHVAASLVQRVIISVVKGISGRAVRKAGKEYMDKNVEFHSTF